MNLRASLLLVIIGSWIAIGAVFIVDSDFGTTQDEPDAPFFYNVPVEDIVSINLKYEDQEVSFTLRESDRRWFFEEWEGLDDVPANLNRFGGITTLLGGPRTQRVLNAEIDNPARYGLDNPVSRYTIGLRSGEQRVLLVGSQTPDGSSTYAQIEGYPALVLIDTSWSGVLDRLVYDPPVPDWMYTMNTDEVRELLVFTENEVIRAYGINRDTDSFYACTLPVREDPCEGDTPVDEEAFQSTLDFIADRQITGIVTLNLQNELDYDQYGADPDAPYFAIRIERPAENSPSVTNVTSVSMVIGDVMPDGEHRYAVINETSDVVQVDRAWADQILDTLFGDTDKLVAS